MNFFGMIQLAPVSLSLFHDFLIICSKLTEIQLLVTLKRKTLFIHLHGQAVSCCWVLSDVQGYLGATGIFALCFGSGYVPTEREEEN